jgi:hypothetical protein
MCPRFIPHVFARSEHFVRQVSSKLGVMLGMLNNPKGGILQTSTDEDVMVFQVSWGGIEIITLLFGCGLFIFLMLLLNGLHLCHQ